MSSAEIEFLDSSSTILAISTENQLHQLIKITKFWIQKVIEGRFDRTLLKDRSFPSRWPQSGQSGWWSIRWRRPGCAGQRRERRPSRVKLHWAEHLMEAMGLWQLQLWQLLTSSFITSSSSFITSCSSPVSEISTESALLGQLAGFPGFPVSSGSISGSSSTSS